MFYGFSFVSGNYECFKRQCWTIGGKSYEAKSVSHFEFDIRQTDLNDSLRVYGNVFTKISGFLKTKRNTFNQINDSLFMKIF